MIETCEFMGLFEEPGPWGNDKVPRVDPTLVRRRLEFVLEAAAGGSIAQMARDINVSEERIQHALRPNKQAFSIDTALAVRDGYNVGLHFLFAGDIADLPAPLLAEVQRWIKEGRWSIDDAAPNFDRPRGKPGRPKKKPPEEG